MSIANLTDRAAVISAINEFNRLGREGFLKKYGFRKARSYMLLYQDEQYDSKAIVGAAYGYQYPEHGPLSSSEFSGGDKTVSRKLTELGFVVVNDQEASEDDQHARQEMIERERLRRQTMLELVRETEKQGAIERAALRDIGIYGGAQGIWVDKKETGLLAEDGVAVSLLHNGSSYDDDISDDGVLYHYPNTKRLGNRDRNEILAVKAAADLHLPVFVISADDNNSKLRNVRLGWVDDWDDASEVFLISFTDEVAAEGQKKIPDLQHDFSLTGDANTTKTVSKQRKGQAKFKLETLKRYGACCAVCSISILSMLDAAHIRPKKNRGSDDPRNGLILCANHHRAYDEGLFAIKPVTFDVVVKSDGPQADALGLSKKSIRHLKLLPHPEALEWAWNHWHAD